MIRSLLKVGVAALLVILAVPVAAQQTTGNVTGRVVDEQGAAIPGVAVTAKNPATGLVRTATTDGEGIYRVTALPIGTYDLTIELSGFRTIDRQGVVINVSQTVNLDATLQLAQVAESVTVTGETPLVDTTSSAVGGVVDVNRVENLPINGRQFANLAATLPGVGLGVHSDPTKGTIFAPQINGGNGRNVNFQVDGGDNNDDTVGGQLQAFPLEAIQEFNFLTQRYKAEFGRSNGGVMNVVTKSGTNRFKGSWFTLYRDDAINARTETEKRNDIEKQDYRRYQYGGSFGGPLAVDRAHFFVAAERTQQDTAQAVDTRGLYPDRDGVFAVPVRETLVTTKVTATLSPSQFLSGRYGYNKNSQPSGVTPQSPPDNWGASSNRFNSVNANHNWVLGGSKLNEFVFQYADFKNAVTANSNLPYEQFPNGVTVGQGINFPQRTEQKKYQFRDDFSWSKTGWGGLGHDFKAGASFINEPRLFITFNSGKGVIQSVHLTDSRTGPIQQVTLNDGEASANIPMKQFSTYFQDDWRVNSQLTLNLGLRYDVMTGYQFDQSLNPNFNVLQEAGRSGRLDGVIGWEDFGQDPKNDYNNIQPRVGAVWNINGTGKNVVRGGWGIYTDVGYTNSNALFAASDATGIGFGPVYNANIATGIRKADGSFYQVGDPLSTIASLNEVNPNALPLFGQVTSPRLQAPFSHQTSFGWAHELTSTMVVNVDYVRVDGRELNVRPRLNVLVNGVRRFADLALNPQGVNTRAGVSGGKSQYDGLIVGLRKRFSHGFDFSGSYTLARALSTIGTAADELDQNYIQDALNPFDDPRMLGPTRRTDARHRITLSGVIMAKGGILVAPIFTFRSALPVFIAQGTDLNGDGTINDIPQTAYAFDGFNADGTAKFKDIGACEKINCGRGASFSQLNVRVSKDFRIWNDLKVEAIGEIFNVFNAINPAQFERASANTQARVVVGGAPNPLFMQPERFAGDFQQPEQLIGQIGFRITF